MASLQDESAIEKALEALIGPVGKKPLSDGFSIEDQNNISIKYVEHKAVVRMSPDGSLKSIVKDDRTRWIDGLSFGPNGHFCLAGSAIPHLVLQGADHLKESAPEIVRTDLYQYACL
ncbi:MAG: hypothetical protein AB8C46_09905 [Burkholderiaceae bacterium]